jgi:PPK2 family polyphosphate:nucleotide phosphotransferase
MEISNINTKAPKDLSKKKIKKKTKELYCELIELHKTMRAEEKHAVLGVFQGMDAAGKDGSVVSLYKGLFPMAASVHAFKAPTEFEASKDFLWRIHQNIPSKGNVVLFNRSHYEDILVPTVHNLFEKDVIKKRYKHINDFENMLEDNGTIVLKFFLLTSKAEQKARFKERTTNIEKKWKYNSNDLAEAKLWDKYMNVYKNIFKKCDVKWEIIPADDKWYRDYLIVKKFVEVLKELKMKYPNTLK